MKSSVRPFHPGLVLALDCLPARAVALRSKFVCPMALARHASDGRRGVLLAEIVAAPALRPVEPDDGDVAAHNYPTAMPTATNVSVRERPRSLTTPCQGFASRGVYLTLDRPC